MVVIKVPELFQCMCFLVGLTVSAPTSGEDSLEDYYRHYPSAIPKFLPVPTDITVHEGETAHLRCRIHNLGPKTVVWRKTSEESPLTINKNVFTPDKNVEIEAEDITEDESRWDLIIKNVSQDQAGTYACQIAAVKNYTLNITINVLDPVEYKPELTLTGTEYVSLYGEIRLRCNATGSTTAPDGVDWFFNGEPVTEIKSRWDGRLVELNQKPSPGRTLISELIVTKVQMDDGGHYVCRLTKTLAEGFKVHVLNDKKDRTDTKRDENPFPEEDDSQSDSMKSRDTNSGSSFTAYQATMTSLLCFFVLYFCRY